MADETIEIRSNHPIEQNWTYLSLWESFQHCERELRREADRANIALAPGVLRAKAQALAYWMRSAREYLRPGWLRLRAPVSLRLVILGG